MYLVAKAFTAHGGRVEDVITRKKRATPPVEPKVTGDVARVIALACSPPPEGRARWTLRLLEKHVIATEGIPPMDHSTIGRVPKGALKPHLKALDHPAEAERRIRGGDGRRPGCLYAVGPTTRPTRSW